MVTMGQIAKAAGVSQATVSRVLSGKSVGFISDATRQRVRAVAMELGFVFPDERLGAGLVAQRGRSGMISIWTCWPTDEWTIKVISALVEYAWRDGYESLIRTLAGSERDAKRAAFSWPVDGIITLGVSGLDAAGTHRSAGRVGRKVSKNNVPVSALTVRGRAVPTVIIGIGIKCADIECSPDMDAIRCNADEVRKGADFPVDAVAAAAWYRLRSRISGPPEHDGDLSDPAGQVHSADAASTPKQDKAAASDGVKKKDAARGVHIWLGADSVPEGCCGGPACTPGATKTPPAPTVRSLPLVERETRLQSADAQLI